MKNLLILLLTGIYWAPALLSQVENVHLNWDDNSKQMTEKTITINWSNEKSTKEKIRYEPE